MSALRPASLLLAAVALLALSGALALPVQAQTTTTFVSNLGQTDASFTAQVNANVVRAQQFETGSNSGGYTLSEIVVNIRAASAGTPAFALYTSTSDDKPGTKVVDLGGESSTAGEQSFTPASATTLSASTKYIIAFYMTSGAAHLQTTTSNAVDPGASPGWNINTTSLYSTNSGTDFNSFGNEIEIAVKGTAVGGAPPSSDATLSGLTVTAGGTDLVTFASDTETYTASVANDVAEVTVTAETNDSGASIDYLDGDDATLDDADTGVDGHQVTLAEGDNVIKVKVTAADGSTKTYTVTVTRAAAASTVLVSNIGQTALNGGSVINNVGQTAQSFSVPSGGGNYTLASIEMGLLGNISSTNIGSLTVVVWSADTSGHPASSLYTLTNPASITTGTASFTAPAGATLEAGNTYVVVGDYNVAAQVTWNSTDSDNEDATSMTGWTIADTGLWYLRTGTSWTARPYALRLRVNGTPSTPELSVGDATATEGSAVEFPVTLSEAVTDGVTATWTASFGSNEEDAAAADLASTTGTLTIGGSDTEGTLTVTTAGDSTDEHDETFTVTLSGVSSNAQLATDPTATGTITDDDNPPSLSVADVSTSESAGYVTIPVLMTPTSGKTVTVLIIASAESGDTAESPGDFSGGNHVSLTLNPGDDRTSTVLLTVDDSIVEPDETFTVTLSNATNAVISDATAKVTITNDDTAAATCTLNTGDLWCGVVTVGTSSNGVGFVAAETETDTDVGALTDNNGDQTITIESDTYTIPSLLVLSGARAGTLAITLDKSFPTDDVNTLEFDVGSKTFKVSEATAYPTGHGYFWADSDLTWSDGGPNVTLRLRRAATLSTDATLSDLTVTAGGTDLVTFASGTKTYTATALATIAEVTVTAETTDSGATVAYLDGDDATITDAGTDAGHQVTLAVGDNVIKVKVTAEDGNATETYTVTVTRAAPTCTLNTGDLWCGVVTVEAVDFLALGIIGYGFTSNVGALSDTTFSVGSNDYTIGAVHTGAGSTAGVLTISLASALTDADKAKLVLHIDGNSDTFAFSVSNLTYEWASTGLVDHQCWIDG